MIGAWIAIIIGVLTALWLALYGGEKGEDGNEPASKERQKNSAKPKPAPEKPE